MQKLLTIFLIFIMSTVGIAQKKKGTTIANDLSEQEVKDFHKQCQIKVQEFQEYLPVIADKTRSDFDRQEAVKAAERLFNAGSTIQVTSKYRKEPVTYTIGEYLTILRDTKKYSQIKIKFYEGAKVSEFTQDPNGGYRGTATVFQEFVGYDKNGKPLYQDRTKKNINTQLNPEFDEFYQEKRWKVLLGNVTADDPMEVPKQ